MELDALKEKWAEHDRKLDVSIRLNRQLLMAANMNRVRSPLRRLAFFVGLGALIGLIGPVILGQFIYQHWAEPRFVLPAVVLHVWVIASLAASIRQIAMALEIDYAKPIALIQKQLESLRVLRIRITQWALLTGQVVWWIPFLIVALKGFWDVDAYKVFGTAFLLAARGRSRCFFRRRVAGEPPDICRKLLAVSAICPHFATQSDYASAMNSWMPPRATKTSVPTA